MISNEIKTYIDQAIAANQKQQLYSIKNASSETHNGIDAPKISYNNLINIPTSSGAKVNSAETSVPSNSGATHFAIAHGLGVTPNFVAVNGEIVISTSPQGGAVYLDPSSPADATNIYVFNTCPSSTVSSLPCYWYAVYIPT